MSKQYAKQYVKQKEKNLSDEEKYHKELVRAYNSAASEYRQDVRELAQQTRGLASKMDTYDSRGTYLRNRQGVQEYNEDLENYKAKLRQLGSYGYDTSSALKAAQRNTIGVKSVGKTSFTKDVVSSLNPKVVNPRETIIGRITGSADKKFQNAVNAELTRRRYQESGQKMPGVGNGSIGSNIAAMQTGRAPNRLESLFNSASAGYRSGMLGSLAAVTGKQDLNTSDADMTFRAGSIGDTSGYELPWISKIKSKISKWAGEQADVLDQESQDSMTLAKDGLGTFGSMLVDAGIAGTQMAMDFGVSALTGGAVNSLGVMGTRVFGQANREAKRNGATDDQAFDYALGNAAVEVLTEKIGNIAAPFAAAYGAGTIDDFIKQGIKNAAKTKAGRLALTTLSSAVSEGGEELISGFMNPLLEAATYGGADALRQFQNPEFWTNVLHDFAVGALMGGFGMAGDAVSVASQQMQQNAADRSLGRTITEAEYTQRLLEANVIQQNQRAGEIAAQLQKAKSGSRRADLLTGRLYNAVNEGETQTAMANRLVTLGVDAETAPTIASGIQNELNGMGATRAELAAMQQYEKQTNRVRTEYEDALEGDDQSSNQWARELGNQQFGRAMDISFAAAERAQRAEAETTEEAPKAETLAVNEQEGVQNNGQSVLPGGGQRYDGQSAGGEVRQLEEGAGRDQSRETWGRPADREFPQSAAPAQQKTVSSRQIHPAGIESDNLYQPEVETESMKRAEKWAQQHGKKAVFFAGDMLTVQHTMPDGTAENVRVRGMIDGDTIYLRADDAQFTSEQIAKHETTHDLLDTGRISRAAVRTALQARYTPEEIDNICHMYAEAFTGMTDAEAWDEIICDSMGGMNIFAQSDSQGKAVILRDILDSVYEEANRDYEARKGKSETRTEERDEGPKFSRDTERLRDEANLSERKEQLAAMQREYNEAEKSRKELQKAPEFQRFMDRIKAANKEEMAQIAADYKEWEESSGLGQAAKTSERLRGEIMTLRGQIERAEREELESARAEYRKQFTPEFATKYATKAARKFGTTSRFGLAGYLTTNGALLDFSAGQGHRVQDHREISEILDFLPENSEYSDGMIEFMNLGNVRLQSYGIDISKMPNAKQIPVLRRFFNSLDGEVTVDFSKENGNTDGSIDYPEGTRADRIIADIKRYFETGEVPELSTTQQFHFSREMDSDYMAAVERGDMETAQRMVDEAAEEAGYDSPKLYHGTKAFGFTVFSDPKKVGYFFTDSVAVASTYSGKENETAVSKKVRKGKDGARRGNYAVYLKMDKPLTIDCQFHNWDDIPISAEESDRGKFYGLVLNNEYATGRYVYTTTDNVVEFAKKNGYDGVIFEDVRDNSSENPKYIPAHMGGKGQKLGANNVYAVLESEQIKSADPVTYDNDGKVIPLSERFNSEKTDIRFSREATNLREANREIEKLRTMAEYWRGQTQRTTRENAGPNERDVLDVAKALIADYGSSEDPQSIRADIRELARYIMRGEPKTHDVRFETVSDMAYRIAQKVVEPTMEVEPFEGMGEQIRKDLRDANIDMTTVKGDFAEGWREIMQITRGKIKNKKGGAGIDTFWMEMQERYGTGVFPEDITNPADQLRYMAELYDQTQTQEIRKPESAYYEEVMWCRNDIIDRVLGEEIRQNPPTRMDKALAKADESKRRAVTRERERMDAAVEKEREKRLDAVASERERASERLDSAVGREREKRLNAVERERERRDAAVDRERERGREAVARERERGRYNTEKAKWEMALRDNAAMRRKQEQLARQAEKFAKEKKDYTERARQVKAEALEKQERKLKEHFREVQRNQRDRRSKTALWRRILAKKNDFLQLKAKPGQAASRHAPAELANALAAVADCFNIENRKRTVNAKGLTKSLADLSKVYEAMKGDERNGVYYDEGLAGFLKQTATAFGSFEAEALSLDELERMDKLLRSFHHTITHANQFMTRQWAIGLIEAGRKWTREVMEAAPVLKGLAGDLLNFQLRPDSFFARLSGFAKNSVGEQVQKMFADSTERMLTVQRAFYQHFREYSEDKRFDKLTARGKKDLVDVGLKDTDGNKVLLTRDMMLAVYKHLSSQDNLEAAAYGGLEIPDLDKYYTGKVAAAFDAHRKTAHADYNLYEIQQQLRDQQELAKNAETEADRAAAEEAAEQLEEQIRQVREEALQTMLDVRARISKMLTDYEKKLVEASESWMDQSAAYINEVTMNMYGFEKANVPKYWPMHRDTNFVQTDMRNAVDEINLENWGSLKERVKSHAPIKLTGFIFELDNHTVKMSRYYGFAEAQRDFNKLYNTQLPSARSSLADQVHNKFGSSKRKLGVSGQQYIDAYLASISGANEVNTSFFSLIRRNLPRATLTLNLRVAVSQLASIPTAAGEIGWGAMVKGMPRGFKTAFSTKAKNELAEKNVWFWQRYRGEGGMREFADMKEEQNWFDRGWNKLAGTKVGKVLFNWCQDFDVLATASMWAMSEEYVKSNTNLKPGTEEFNQRVGEVYRDVIRKTQPNYTETERSDLLRDKRESMKFLTMYKTQSNQNLNIVYEASARFAQYKRDLKNGKNGVTQADVDQAGKQLARSYTAVLLGGTLAFSILRAAANAILHNMNAYRDDDDEVTLEGILNGILDETIGAFAGMFAFGSEIESAVMAIIKKEKYWGLTDSAVSALSDLVEQSVDAIQKATDADKDLSRDDVEKLVKTWAQILGVPYDNGKKIYEGVWGHIEDIQNGEFLSFESGVKRTGKTEAKKLVDAMLDGDKERAEKAWEHLLETKADKKDPEGTAQNAVKDHLKDLYFDDGISEKQMKKLLKTLGWDDDAKIDEFVTSAKCKKETGYYPDKLKEGYLQGAFGDKKAIQYLKEYKGKDQEEAEETLNYWKMNKKYGFDYNDTGDMYAKGKISEKEAKTILMTYGGYSEEDAGDKVLKWGVNKEYGFDYDDTRDQYVKGNISGEEAAEIWSKYGGMEDEKIADRLLTADFLAEHPEVDEDNVTANRVELYDLIGKGANIPADKFMEYAKKVKTFHGEVDAKGKSIPYSTQDKVIAWIDTLDLSPAQKTAVFATYFDEGKIPTNSYKRIKW